MPTIEQLLAAKKRKGHSPEVSSPQTMRKIKREGPTRPWQENLPQYALSEESMNQRLVEDLPPIDSATTREQTTLDSVTTVVQTITQTGTAREQAPLHTETTQEQIPVNSGTTPEQNLIESGTSREQKAPKTVTTREQNPRESVTTRKQKGSISEAKPTQSVTTQEQKSGTREQTREQKTALSVTTQQRISGTREQTREQEQGNKKASDSGTNKANNWATKGYPIPASSCQLAILKYLLSLQLKTESNQTPIVSKAQIQRATGIDKASVKTQVYRLLDKQLLKRVHYSRSCTGGGSIYAIPDSVKYLLWSDSVTSSAEISVTNNGLNSGTNSASPGGQVTDVSSSSKLITTTNPTATLENPEKKTCDQLLDIVNKLDIEKYKIGANDLYPLLREGEFKDLHDLRVSLEHISFYLHSSEADSISHPKAWMMKQLKKGYYAAPAGFKSYEELQAEAKFVDAKDRLAKIQEVKQKHLEVEFEIWLSELSSTETKKLTNGLRLNSPGAKALLKETYLQRVSGIT